MSSSQWFILHRENLVIYNDWLKNGPLSFGGPLKKEFLVPYSSGMILLIRSGLNRVALGLIKQPKIASSTG